MTVLVFPSLLLHWALPLSHLRCCRLQLYILQPCPATCLRIVGVDGRCDACGVRLRAHFAAARVEGNSVPSDWAAPLFRQVQQDGAISVIVKPCRLTTTIATQVS